MFTPKFTITNSLLANIKRITSLIYELNARHFPKIALLEFERAARAVSTHASTSIEGNPLPLTEVKKVLKSQPENIRDSEREVLNYNHALETLDVSIKKETIDMSLGLILTIHTHVTQGLLPVYETGKLRQKPVVVNDPRSGKIVYLPPYVKNVEPLLIDLIDFVKDNTNTIDPLILAGLFHKQMVIIHPFMDGNGRTTRLATKVLLAKMGLNTFNLFSFENYYNQNVTKYFQTVGERGDYNELVNTIDFTNWLQYFTDGIIDELLRVQKNIPTFGISPATRIEPHHTAILTFMRKSGLITDRDYATLTDRSKATRALDFNKLIDLGLIERRGDGRSTYYVPKVIDF